jgi:hypothetical protein
VRKSPSGVVTTDAYGTSAGTITVNGVTRRLPVQGRYVVPGLARFDTRLVTKTANSVTAVAVRVTFTSRTAANTVVNLGYAGSRIASH